MKRQKLLGISKKDVRNEYKGIIIAPHDCGNGFG